MRTKQVKPPKLKFEYELQISKEYDEIKKKEYISFRFGTTQTFLVFSYILKIASTVKDKKLRFDILGFSAPMDEISVSGKAGFEYRMFDYKFREYDITVGRKDTKPSKFKLKIIPNTRDKKKMLKLRAIQRDSFINIKIQPYEK